MYTAKYVTAINLSKDYNACHTNYTWTAQN